MRRCSSAIQPALANSRYSTVEERQLAVMYVERAEFVVHTLSGVPHRDAPASCS